MCFQLQFLFVVEIFSADPDISHVDTITGVDVTHKMRLFASCSLDCTVRIWTEDNLPIRWGSA